ncbi:MAG: hypothetical protein ACTSYM_07235 [Candidatus Baldrarchaeia archaeon]
MKKLGFLPCLLITLIIGVILEFTKIWQLLVIAGIIGGFLAKNAKTAALSGFLGLLFTWGVFFLANYVKLPCSFTIAFSNLSMFLGIGLILIALLGLFSALIGYFSAALIEKQ